MTDPRTLREGDLDFTFDAGWTVFRHWDAQSVYIALNDQVPGSRAVDIVGVRDRPRAIYLIEIKDYRTSEAQPSTRKKLANDGRDLAAIVATKVRDTVAGLIGAARQERDDDWSRTHDALAEHVWVVLWIEHTSLTALNSVRDRRNKGEAVVLKRSIATRCRWLRAQVEVCSRGGSCLPGLTVKSVAGAARTPGRRSRQTAQSRP